jgi:hypothetical protein
MNSPASATRPQRLHRARVALAIVGLSAAVSACAAGQRQAQPFERAGAARATEVQIVAQNREFSAATLYAISLGERRKLGVLEGKAEATYTIPWRSPGPMQIEIVLLARGTCLTDELIVDPGDVLELQIEPENQRVWRCGNPRGGGD